MRHPGSREGESTAIFCRIFLYGGRKKLAIGVKRISLRDGGTFDFAGENGVEAVWDGKMAGKERIFLQKNFEKEYRINDDIT